MVQACLSLASSREHNWPNRIFTGDFRECTNSCDSGLTGKMDCIIANHVAEEIEFSFRGELEGNLVAMFTTYSQELVGQVIPANALFNSKLIEHYDLMYNLKSTRAFARVQSVANTR